MTNAPFPKKLKVDPLYEIDDTRPLVMMPTFLSSKSSLGMDMFLERVRTHNLRVLHVCLEALP